LKAYEREAFAKTFGIFFLSLSLLVSAVTYGYYKEQKHATDEQIFEQMRAFSYDFITPPINNLNYAIILDGKNRRKKIITKRVV
jgi:hypothetical protein